MVKRRKNRAGRGLSFLIIVMLLPLLVTIVMQNMQINRLMAGMGQAGDISAGEVPDETLIGIVAKEMDAGFPDEALRAQSVIARTNYLDAKKKGTKMPQGMSLEEMQEAFGDNFNKIYEKLKNCVNSTENEVLTWQGDYIYAAYHAVSSGSTRNMEELYGDVHTPYLTCLECHDDTVAEGYLAVCYWKKEEFLQLVNGAFPEAGASDTSQIQVTARDKAEYVLSVQVGGSSCSGEEFRSALGLNSACFTITDTGENIRIVTRGIGHGFGLSQHMAQVLAEQGKDYREILAYFFPETELTETEKMK